MERSKGISINMYILIIFVSVILLFPCYWMLVTSVMSRKNLLTYPPQLLPNIKEITFSAYFGILEKRPIIRWLLNSLSISFFSTIITMIISSLAAYSISRYSSRFNRLMGYSLLIIRMLPSTVLIIPFYIIVLRLGLLNNQLPLIIGNVAFNTPFAVWMMKAFYDGIPVSLEEAAQIDGCTPLQALWKIILPLTAPGLTATGIYCLVLSWNEFLLARTFLTGQEHWTITVGMSSLIGEYVILWNEIMAGGIVAIFPVVIAFIILEKYLVAGMTAGSVKQ